MLAFHGAGGTGDGFAGGTGFSDDRRPLRLRGALPERRRAPVLEPQRQDGHRPTSTTLRALLPQAFALACTDRVFATGVSNGGGFAARVGCELDDVVAIAPVAGGYRALDRCPSSRAHVGARDPRHRRPRRPLPRQEARLRRLGPALPRRLGPPRRLRRQADRNAPRRRSSPTSATRAATTGLAVEHLRLAGVDHGWPEQLWGLDTNDAVLRFFAVWVDP